MQDGCFIQRRVEGLSDTNVSMFYHFYGPR